MTLEQFCALCALIFTVSGATWVLHKSLSKISEALITHVADDVAQFKDLTARVVNIETAKKRRK